MNLEPPWAIRSLWRSKRFAFPAIVTFALGIGATATVFSVVDAVLLRPATFPNADSVISVQYSEKYGAWDTVPPAAFRAIEMRRDLFSQTAAARLELFTVTKVPAPDQVFGLSVSGQYFMMLAARPVMGRLIVPDDDRPGAPGVALLSYRGWQRLFDSDPNVLGKAAEIDGREYTVIGVLPRDFVAPGENTAGVLWTALRLTQADLDSPEARHLQVYARVRQNVPAARVRAFLDQLASVLDSNASRDRRPIYLRSQPWHEGLESTRRYSLWLAMCMTCGLLLIGCANVSSLLLARGVGNSRDHAIRLATGASRGKIIRQSLLEVALLSLIAFVIASVGASAALHLIRNHLSAVGTGIPNLARIRLNADSLLFALGITAFSALICGLLPALFTTRIDLSTGLRDAGLNAGGRRSVRRLLYGIVTLQAAVSMLLLLSSGLLVRSLLALMSEDHGLRSDHVLTLRLPKGSWDAYDATSEHRERQLAQYLQVLEHAQNTPGVQATALASSLPLSNTVTRTRLKAPASVASADVTIVLPVCQAVTRDYFRVMGIPVLAGRTFTAFDSASKLNVGVINEAFLHKYFDDQNPIGQFLYNPDSREGIQIIGLVKDSPHLDYSEAVEPQIYLQFEKHPMTPFLTGLVVRTLGNPQSVANTLRSALAVDNQPVVSVQTFETLIRDNTWQPRFLAWLFSCFAIAALCLSAIGIYGVSSYAAASGKRDYGIRLSIGAQPVQVFRLAVFNTLLPVLAGVSFGAVGAYWTSKWIASLLYHVGPFDTVTVVITIAILVVLALAACAGPALRAARVDPVTTLRHE